MRRLSSPAPPGWAAPRPSPTFSASAPIRSAPPPGSSRRASTTTSSSSWSIWSPRRCPSGARSSRAAARRPRRPTRPARRARPSSAPSTPARRAATPGRATLRAYGRRALARSRGELARPPHYSLHLAPISSFRPGTGGGRGRGGGGGRRGGQERRGRRGWRPGCDAPMARAAGGGGGGDAELGGHAAARCQATSDGAPAARPAAGWPPPSARWPLDRHGSTNLALAPSHRGLRRCWR